MNTLKNNYINDGYLHISNFLDNNLISKILFEAKTVFFNQFKLKKYTLVSSVNELSEIEFNQMLYQLFTDDIQLISNCGKQIQHLISLHKLSLDDKIIKLLYDLGIEMPNISTRPVLYFNHPKLAKEKIFNKVDAHQDWRRMQGSLNSVVIWVPLVDIDKELGALEIIPKSHLFGLLTDHVDHGFGMIDSQKFNESAYKTIEVKVGDILLFSSFLIHQSGDNITNSPRWSCHFRYNDLKEISFIDRGYPHAYIYKPVDTLLTSNFPSRQDIINTFKNE